MEKQRFSRFNNRVWAAVAVSAALFVPLGVFGAPALARSASAASEYQYSGSSQYQYKVTICHKTHSKKHPFHQISVSVNAAKAHLRHGDTLGLCPTVAPPAPKKHGHGDEHGNGNGKSNDQHGNDDQGNGNGNSGNDNHGGGNGNGGGKGHH
jgi:uncharacterized membrane protein YgcG